MSGRRSVEILFSNELVGNVMVQSSSVFFETNWLAKMEPVTYDDVAPQQLGSWGIESQASFAAPHTSS